MQKLGFRTKGEKRMLVIGLCIGFIVGNITGVVFVALMNISSREDRRRETEDDLQRYESNN